MGFKVSKADGNAANVINIVEVIDHTERPQTTERNVLRLIALSLWVLNILRGLQMYKRSVQRRRDHGHELEKIVASTTDWAESSREKTNSSTQNN